MDSIATPQTDDSLFAPGRRGLSVGAVALCSMIAFEAIGVAAGMPAVALALDGIGLYALAFAGTLASSVVAMVWAGRDCDRHGPHRSMATGMLLFAAGLLMAGLANSMELLVAGRVVQGLGVGTLGVALYVATAQAFPEKLHPRLFALFSSAWVVPAIVGPALSGWIVDHIGWRWLFLAIVALLLPTALMVLPPLRTTTPTVMPQHPDRRRPLHWALLASASLLALSLSAQAGRLGLAVVIVSLAAVLLSSVRLLPPGTLRFAPGLPSVLALRGVNSAAFFLCEAFIPLWLHQQRGWSITAAGLALTGGALSWSLGSWIQSHLSEESTRMAWLARGCVLLLVGILGCDAAVIGLLPPWIVLPGWCLSGLGVGLSLPMLSVLMLKLSPRHQQGQHSSALQLCTSLCTGAALAVGGVLFSLQQSDAPTRAFASVFALASALALLSLLHVQRVKPVSASA